MYGFRSWMTVYMALKRYNLASLRVSFLSAGIRATSSLTSVQTKAMTLRSNRLSPNPTLRNLHTRSYSPSTITAAAQQPSSLQGLHLINIQEPEYYTDNSNDIHARADPWEPSHVLPILESLPDVISITVDVNQIMFHSATTDSEARHHSETGVPEIVLQRLGLSAKCTGLCTWTVKEYPKVTIQHSMIRELLTEIKNYIDDKEQWKAIIQAQDTRPEYKAFDYTAEFHSRDVCAPEDECEGPYVDLGLYGVGNYHCGSASELSMDFLGDFLVNKEVFRRHPRAWRPDLYEKLRARHGAVSSNLKFQEWEEV